MTEAVKAAEAVAGAEPHGAEPDGAHAPAQSRPRPELRGETTIADRVVERIAARALTEVDPARGSARRVLGVPLGSDRTQGPQVDAQVDGDLATLQMTVSVIYPAPIRAVARQVRERVTTRVRELTGLDVRQVDITIANLLQGGRRAGRVQ